MIFSKWLKMRLFLILVWCMKVTSAKTLGSLTVADDKNETRDNIWSSASETLLEAFDLAFEICPNIHFCAHGKTTNSSDDYKEENLKISEYNCCFQCSCTDDCALFNSCCPDAPALANLTGIQDAHLSKSNIPNKTTDIHESTPELSCELPFVPFGNRYFKQFVNSPGIHRYNIVNTCSNQSIAESCAIAENEELDDDGIDLKDFQIVSSADGKTLYRNEKCAACNGVTSIRRWEQHAVECKRKLTSFTRILSPIEILDNCLVKSVPPADLDYSSFLCFQPDIHISNCSNSQSQLDQVIANLCTNGHYYPYYKISFTTTLEYKNIFCYLCNVDNKETTGKTPVCGNARRTIGSTLTYLLDPTLGYHMDTMKDQTPKCPIYEAFDSHLRRCRKLYCDHIFQLSLDGRCVKHGFTMDEIALKQLVKLLARTNDTRASYDHVIDAYDKILDEITNAFKIRDHCSMTKLTILDIFLSPMTTDVDQLIAEIEVRVTSECSYEFLTEKIRSPFESHIEVRIGGAVHTFDMELLVKMNADNTNNNLYDGYNGINVLSTFQRNIMERFEPDKEDELLYFQTPVMTCPFYILSQNEFCSLMLNNTETSQTSSLSCEDVDNLLFKRFTVVTSESMLEKRYFICTEAYAQLFKNSSNSTKITYMILSFVLLRLF